MYFEEIKRRPTKKGGKQQLTRSKRQERERRKTTQGQMNREENLQRSERRRT